jgi:hypothetical protein
MIGGGDHSRSPVIRFWMTVGSGIIPLYAVAARSCKHVSETTRRMLQNVL